MGNQLPLKSEKVRIYTIIQSPISSSSHFSITASNYFRDSSSIDANSNFISDSMSSYKFEESKGNNQIYEVSDIEDNIRIYHVDYPVSNDKYFYLGTVLDSGYSIPEQGSVRIIPKNQKFYPVFDMNIIVPDSLSLIDCRMVGDPEIVIHKSIIHFLSVVECSTSEFPNELNLECLVQFIQQYCNHYEDFLPITGSRYINKLLSAIILGLTIRKAKKLYSLILPLCLSLYDPKELIEFNNPLIEYDNLLSSVKDSIPILKKCFSNTKIEFIYSISFAFIWCKKHEDLNNNQSKFLCIRFLKDLNSNKSKSKILLCFLYFALKKNIKFNTKEANEITEIIAEQKYLFSELVRDWIKLLSEPVEIINFLDTISELIPLKKNDQNEIIKGINTKWASSGISEQILSDVYRAIKYSKRNVFEIVLKSNFFSNLTEFVRQNPESNAINEYWYFMKVLSEASIKIQDAEIDIMPNSQRKLHNIFDHSLKELRIIFKKIKSSKLEVVHLLANRKYQLDYLFSNITCKLSDIIKILKKCENSKYPNLKNILFSLDSFINFVSKKMYEKFFKNAKKELKYLSFFNDLKACEFRNILAKNFLERLLSQPEKLNFDNLKKCNETLYGEDYNSKDINILTMIFKCAILTDRLKFIENQLKNDKELETSKRKLNFIENNLYSSLTFEELVTFLTKLNDWSKIYWFLKDFFKTYNVMERTINLIFEDEKEKSYERFKIILAIINSNDYKQLLISEYLARAAYMRFEADYEKFCYLLGLVRELENTYQKSAYEDLLFVAGTSYNLLVFLYHICNKNNNFYENFQEFYNPVAFFFEKKPLVIDDLMAVLELLKSFEKGIVDSIEKTGFILQLLERLVENRADGGEDRLRYIFGMELEFKFRIIVKFFQKILDKRLKFQKYEIRLLVENFSIFKEVNKERSLRGMIQNFEDVLVFVDSVIESMQDTSQNFNDLEDMFRELMTFYLNQAIMNLENHLELFNKIQSIDEKVFSFFIAIYYEKLLDFLVNAPKEEVFWKFFKPLKYGEEKYKLVMDLLKQCAKEGNQGMFSNEEVMKVYEIIEGIPGIDLMKSLQLIFTTKLKKDFSICICLIHNKFNADGKLNQLFIDIIEYELKKHNDPNDIISAHQVLKETEDPSILYLFYKTSFIQVLFNSIKKRINTFTNNYSQIFQGIDSFYRLYFIKEFLKMNLSSNFNDEEAENLAIFISEVENDSQNLQLLDDIENCSIKKLKELYVYHVANIINDLRLGDYYLIEKVFQLQSLYFENNMVFKMLVDILFKRFHAFEEKTITNILVENISATHGWFLLLKYSDHSIYLRKYEIYDLIYNYFRFFIESIYNKTILVKHIEMISQQNSEMREIFNFYIQYFFKNDEECSKQFYEEIIINKRFIKEYLLKLERTLEILKIYCENSKDYLQVVEELKSYFLISEKKICECIFPEMLLDLIEKSCCVYKVYDLEIFKYYSLLNKPKSYTVRGIIENRYFAFSLLDNVVGETCRNINNLKFNELPEVFIDFMDAVEKYIHKISPELYETSLIPIQKFIRLKTCESDLIMLSKCSCSLQRRFSFATDKGISKAKEYLKTITEKNQNQSSILIIKYVDDSEQCEKLLKPPKFTDRHIESLAKTINLFNESKDLCEILETELSGEKFHDMRECIIEEKENTPLNLRELAAFEYIWRFRNDIKNQIGLVNVFETFAGERFKELDQQILTARGRETDARKLWNDVDINNQVKKKDIDKILKNSIIKIFYFAEENQFTGSIFQERKIYELKDIKEYSERATKFISLYKGTDKNQDTCTVLTEFVTLSSYIYKISELLNNLINYGYPQSRLEDKEFPCIEKNYDDFLIYHNSYESHIESWKGIMTEKYKNYHDLTFMHGQQLSSFGSSNDLASLSALKFMQKKRIDVDDVKIALRRLPKKTDAEERYETIGGLLKTADTFPAKLLVAKEPSKANAKFFMAFVGPNGNFVKGMLHINFIASKSEIRAYQVFYCYPSTLQTEMYVFISRIILSRNNEIFFLINCEKLKIDVQNLFIKYLLESISDSSCINYKIGFISECDKSVIHNFIKEQSQILELYQMKDEDMEDSETIKRYIEPVCGTSLILSSSLPGLGKSTYINDTAVFMKIPRFELNLTGVITYDELKLTLEKIDPKNKVLLHIQLSYVQNIDMMNEVLASLALFKQLYTPNNIFCLNSESLVYIEIATTCLDLSVHSVYIKDYVNSHNINELDWRTLKIANPQLIHVCAYLELYKSDNPKININTNEIQYDTGLGMSSMSLNQIMNLLPEKLKVQYTVNYYQIDLFVKIMHFLLKNFEKWSFNYAIYKDYLQKLKRSVYYERMLEMRKTIMEALLMTSIEFTVKSLHHARNIQEESQKMLKDNKVPDDFMENAFEKYIRWEDSQHFNLIYTDNYEHLFIYKTPSAVPQNIRDIMTIQDFLMTNKGKFDINVAVPDFEFPDFNNMSSENLIELFRKYKIEKVEKGNQPYLVTPDNFLKMNIILVKALASIPIIVIGETGCGKTSLISYLVIVILQEKLEVLNVHAGVGIQEIRECILNYCKIANEIYPKRLWVFFDEFNTSDYIGTFAEILINRQFEGLSIQDNIIFMGACNPYRLKSHKLNNSEGIGLQKGRKYKNMNSKLLHIVKPLPLKILEFITDYGSLRKQELEIYTKSILESVASIQGQNSIFLVKIICKIHDYFCSSEDTSSVSLRDVVRFSKLAVWFKDSIEKRKDFILTENSQKFLKNNKVSGYPTDLSENDILIRAWILALIHCYYLRLPNEESRLKILELISSAVCLNPEYSHLDEQSCFKITEEYLKNEQYDLVSRFTIDKKYAINLALRENIFAILPCIFNKIPIFICGKPGCSKSLAVNIINSNFTEQLTRDEYILSLGQIFVVYLQGSDTCTSETIQKVFEKAEKIRIAYEKQNIPILPVIVFDEIGLAEVSKHNPLKILHSLLEIENIKTAFIGITNWRLDASKMNRALYLFRGEPQLEELKSTAKLMLKNIRGKKISKSIIDKASRFYIEIKNELRNTNFRDFYGLRDFYSTIKMLGEGIPIEKCIQHNFRGLSQARKISTPNEEKKCISIEKTIKDIARNLDINFKIAENARFPAINLIRENIEKPDSRFLMIIASRESILIFFKMFLSLFHPRHQMIVGSTFEDAYDETVCMQNVVAIKQYVEEGFWTFFYEADAIYSALYDLFNQNFYETTSSNKQGSKQVKSCRIAVDNDIRPKSIVHDDFKAIIFLENEDKNLKYTDPPFLNRFEKHHLDADDLVKEYYWTYEKLLIWLGLLKDESGVLSEIHLIFLFPIYNEESLKLIVYAYSSQRKEQNPNAVFEDSKRFLLQIAPRNICIDYAKYLTQDSDLLMQEWENCHKFTFEKTLDLMKSNYHFKYQRLIAFTYDFSDIKQQVEGRFFKTIEMFKLYDFKLEEDIKKTFDNFFANTKKELCIIDVNFEFEEKHYNSIILILDRYGCKNFPKPVVLLVRLNPKKLKKVPLWICEEWETFMFDSITFDGFNLG